MDYLDRENIRKDEMKYHFLNCKTENMARSFDSEEEMTFYGHKRRIMEYTDEPDDLSCKSTDKSRDFPLSSDDLSHLCRTDDTVHNYEHVERPGNSDFLQHHASVGAYMHSDVGRPDMTRSLSLQVAEDRHMREFMGYRRCHSYSPIQV